MTTISLGVQRGAQLVRARLGQQGEAQQEPAGYGRGQCLDRRSRCKWTTVWCLSSGGCDVVCCSYAWVAKKALGNSQGRRKRTGRRCQHHISTPVTNIISRCARGHIGHLHHRQRFRRGRRGKRIFLGIPRPLAHPTTRRHLRRPVKAATPMSSTMPRQRHAVRQPRASGQ